ncbi:MAG: lipid-A-disaccharide synthase [Desulfovibrionaceae bacterium]
MRTHHAAPDGTFSGHDGLLWISAGEPSGDMHGALLLKALRRQAPDMAITGMGGPAMAEAGCEIRHGIEQVSHVGLGGIVFGLPGILALLRRIRKDLKRLRPRAVVLIDCPEFNFRVAKIAHSLDIPAYYYISPQIWAWRSGRVNFLKKHVRKMLCLLPFEEAFYEERGMKADYVGHPLMDQLPLTDLDQLPVEMGTLGLLPGSRLREIRSLLPLFAEATRRIHARHPLQHVLLVRAPGVEESLLRSLWPADLPCEIIAPQDRYQAMRRSRFLLAASGTVTLEAALIGTPALLSYRLSRLEYRLSQWLVNVQYAGLPNLILNREVYPELIQDAATAGNIASTALDIMAEGQRRQTLVNDLQRLRTMVGEPGAPDRAATIIFNDLFPGVCKDTSHA